jgi:hypothetical protein
MELFEAVLYLPALRPVPEPHPRGAGEGNPNARLMLIGEGPARRRIGWAAPLWARPESF